MIHVLAHDVVLPGNGAAAGPTTASATAPFVQSAHERSDAAGTRALARRS